MRAQLHAFEHFLNARAADDKRFIVTCNSEGIIVFGFQLVYLAFRSFRYFFYHRSNRNAVEEICCPVEQFLNPLTGK
ncbi:hypothetical protein D3C80_1559340 [compost metagenome]